MKKLIIISFLSIFLAELSIAQSLEVEKTNFAVLGGVNFQNLTGKDFNGNNISSSGLLGFHVGVNAMIPIVPEFYFQPGLLFSTKGAKISESVVTKTINISYIELPLNLVYKSRLGSGSIFIGFGPYVGYGIKGSAAIDNGQGSIKSDVEFKNVVDATDPITKTYLKALDIGGNLFAGYKLPGGIFVQLNTQYGMININPEDNRYPGDQTSIKNTGFGLSVGYSF
jgi:hypothetical protein